MIEFSQSVAAAVLAVSAKAYGGIFVVGLALSDVSNPVIAVGAVAAAILALVALFTKAYRGLTQWTLSNARQARMLAQFEGAPGTPGVMDEIKSLHVGQADILIAVNELRQSASRRREGDLP